MKEKWNGKMNQIVEDSGRVLWCLENCTVFVTATDVGSPKESIIELVGVVKKLNSVVKYAIESGRISPLKALEIMGETAKIEDITQKQ